jgi:hypothetical protein
VSDLEEAITPADHEHKKAQMVYDDDGARACRCHRRRTAPTDLQVLPSGAGDADPRSADAAQ